MALRLQTVGSLSGLDDLREVWERLEQRYEAASVFQSWLWCRAWLESAPPSVRPRVQVVEDDRGQVLAILPLCERRLLGPFFSLVGFIGGQTSYGNDILLAGAEAAVFLDDIIDLSLKDIGPCAVMHLKNLNGDAPFTKRLAGERGAAPMCTRFKLRRAPDPTGQFHYLSKPHQKQLIYKQRKLAKDHGLAFKVELGAALPAALETLVELHVKRSQSIGRRTLLVGANLEFLRSIVVLLSEKFCVIELQAAGGTIASNLVCFDRGRCYGIQSGFDPDFARYSPMRILINETIRQAFERSDCHEIDMGSGYDRYKLEWNPTVTWNYYSCRGGVGPYAKLAAKAFGRVWSRSLPQSFGASGEVARVPARQEAELQAHRVSEGPAISPSP